VSANRLCVVGCLLNALLGQSLIRGELFLSGLFLFRQEAARYLPLRAAGGAPAERAHRPLARPSWMEVIMFSSHSRRFEIALELFRGRELAKRSKMVSPGGSPGAAACFAPSAEMRRDHDLS